MTDAQQKIYDEQIDEVVRGFVQVWNKFESVLSRELAQIQEQLGEIHPDKEPHTTNYELFYRVSSIVAKGDSLSMGELSNALSVPLSTATRIVDWLVDRGYLQRLPDPEDRRIVRVALTDSGKQIHKTIESYIRQRLQQILSCLTISERAKLIVLIQKVVGALKEETK